MKFLHLLWSNLKRKKLRTILTVLSIFVAFLLFGFLSAIQEALTGGVSMAGADRLVTRHKVSIIQLLPESYKARMLRHPGVANVAHQTWFGAIYQDPKNFFPSMPVEPEALFDLFPEFVLPEAEKKAWLGDRSGAIVGRTTAQRFGWKVGDRIPLRSPIWTRKGGETWEFNLVGIFDGAKKRTDTSQFFFRYDYFNEARAYGEGQVGWYTLRVKDPAQAEQVAREIDEEFANSPYETKTEPEGAFAKAFAEQVGNIGTIMVGIVSAVFFTILLVAGNTMAQAVRERIEEIGVLKALGFTDRGVLGLVLGESCLVAVVGGVCGLGFAWLVTAAGNPVPNLLPLFYIPPRDLVVGLGMVVILGVLAGALPAWQAGRLQIADALKR